MNALIRFHLNLNPDLLTEDEFAQRWCELDWVLKQESKKVSGE